MHEAAQDWLECAEARYCEIELEKLLKEIKSMSSRTGFGAKSLVDGDSTCLNHTKKNKRTIHNCIETGNLYDRPGMGWTQTGNNKVDKVAGAKQVLSTESQEGFLDTARNFINDPELKHDVGPVDPADFVVMMQDLPNIRKATPVSYTHLTLPPSDLV